MIYKSRSVDNDDMGNSKTVHNDHHHVGINNLVDGADEIHDQSEQIVKEVLKIKEILTNEDELQSETQVRESLSRLESISFSVETLKATMVGRDVKLLRKHRSKTISSMAKKLVRRWRQVADERLKSDEMAAAAVQLQVQAEVGGTYLEVDESERKNEGSVLVFKRNAQNQFVFSHRRQRVVKPASPPLPSTSPHVTQPIFTQNNKNGVEDLKLQVQLGNQIPCKDMSAMQKSKCCDEKSVGERIEASKRRIREGYL